LRELALNNAQTLVAHASVDHFIVDAIGWREELSL